MAAMMIGMSACSKVNNDIAKDVCDYLEQQYGCKFVATHIGDRLDKDTAKLYVYSEENPEVIFTAIIDHDGNVEEDYVPNLIAAKIEKSIASDLSRSNIECTVSASIDDNSIVEKNTSISVEEFVQKYGIESIYVKIIFDETLSNTGAVIDSLESASTSLKTNLTVRGYIFSHDSYSNCRDEFLKYPYVGSTAIKAYSPKKEFLIQVQNGKCDIDKDGLSNVLG